MKTSCSRCPLYAPKNHDFATCCGVNPPSLIHDCATIDELIDEIDKELARRKNGGQ
jgi:hypothetical protein